MRLTLVQSYIESSMWTINTPSWAPRLASPLPQKCRKNSSFWWKPEPQLSEGNSLAQLHGFKVSFHCAYDIFFLLTKTFPAALPHRAASGIKSVINNWWVPWHFQKRVNQICQIWNLGLFTSAIKSQVNRETGLEVSPVFPVPLLSHCETKPQSSWPLHTLPLTLKKIEGNALGLGS